MKKTIFSLLVFAGIAAHAQVATFKEDTNVSKRVGINTDKPQASLDIKETAVDSHIQGLSLPNFSTTDRDKLGAGSTSSMKIGTLIYNTTLNCIEMYEGYENGKHKWTCLALSKSL